MAAKLQLPPKDLVIKWKEEKVIKWLKRVHLDDCIPAFEHRHIDGIKLLDLTEQKLFTYQDLKIKYRKQIAKCVQECKSQASNAKRIARTIKNRQDSQSGAVDTNGGYCSDDSDDWGSDFEDESDDEDSSSQVCELNNNTIIETSVISGVSEQNSSNKSSEKQSQEKLIPKPPDVPVIPNVINGPSIRKTSHHTNSIPRPPVKRPPSQPPPPPVPQVTSPDDDQEDYEIPIVSTTNLHRENSELSDSSFHSVMSIDFAAETYELIEPPEETYELVDAPSSTSNLNEKPVLPPRIPLSSGAISSPPPLPQKPRRLIDNMLTLDRPEGVRTFTRPKPPQRTEVEAESVSSSSASSMGFIGSLIGRRSSNSSPLSASPKTSHKTSTDGIFSSNHSVVSSSDGLSSRSSSPDKDALHTVGRSSFIMPSSTTQEVKKATPLPHLPLRNSPSVSDETAQNMATRPLPPVPMPKEEKTSNTQQEDLQNHPWYHEIERENAEEIVKSLKVSGAFVVRPSKRAGIDNPFSLTILHDEKLFHLNIRHRPDNTFALGKEKKKEKTFACVADLIAFHQTEPILLTSRGEPAGKTILSKYPEK